MGSGGAARRNRRSPGLRSSWPGLQVPNNTRSLAIRPERVFLFLQTDDFWRDYKAMMEKGIVFVREPKQADYGLVAVFLDLYGNRWDLIGPAPA